MEYTTLEQVKIRLKQFHIDTVTNDDDTTSDVVVFDSKVDNPVIEQLIKQATEEVKARRNYPDSYTDEMITEDLKKFESVIVNLAVYDHSQAGEAFMASYNENGINRTWRDRDSLFVVLVTSAIISLPLLSAFFVVLSTSCDICIALSLGHIKSRKAFFTLWLNINYLSVLLLSITGLFSVWSDKSCIVRSLLGGCSPSPPSAWFCVSLLIILS
jgi:hypothetical protein